MAARSFKELYRAGGSEKVSFEQSRKIGETIAKLSVTVAAKFPDRFGQVSRDVYDGNGFTLRLTDRYFPSCQATLSMNERFDAEWGVRLEA